MSKGLQPFKRRKSFWAIQYSGSGTQARSISEWVESGVYQAPGVETRYINPFTLRAGPKNRPTVVQPYDYVVTTGGGSFFVVNPDLFELLFKADWDTDD